MFYIDYESKDVQGEWFNGSPCKSSAFATREEAEQYIQNRVKWHSLKAFYNEPVIKTTDVKFEEMRCKNCVCDSIKDWSSYWENTKAKWN